MISTTYSSSSNQKCRQGQPHFFIKKLFVVEMRKIRRHRDVRHLCACHMLVVYGIHASVMNDEKKMLNMLQYNMIVVLANHLKYVFEPPGAN
jgi:hypothetical protein